MAAAPMDYQVKIDIFEGPMDLLLHLIQKNDLDIYDIPICQITNEYLSYIDLLKDLNLNIAGDFLVMASSLMQIKAKTLLPQEPNENNEEGPDPRAELVQRLVEYQRFKEVSKMLSGRFDAQKDVMYRGSPIFSKDDQILEVSLDKLLDGFKNVLRSADENIREIIVEEIPVEVRIREILDSLETRPYLTFSDLFPASASRKILVVSFLALLELIRLKQVRATQAASFGEIHIERVQNEEGAAANPAAVPA